MQLVKFDPFRDLLQVERDIKSMLENGWTFTPALTETSALDMYEEGGKLIAELALPNFKKDEIRVTADEQGLEVSAEHREKEEKKETKKRKYFFHESRRNYWRRVALPKEPRPDKITAKFVEGKLKIVMPLIAKKTKSISIK